MSETLNIGNKAEQQAGNKQSWTDEYLDLYPTTQHEPPSIEELNQMIRRRVSNIEEGSEKREVGPDELEVAKKFLTIWGASLDPEDPRQQVLDSLIRTLFLLSAPGTLVTLVYFRHEMAKISNIAQELGVNLLKLAVELNLDPEQILNILKGNFGRSLAIILGSILVAYSLKLVREDFYQQANTWWSEGKPQQRTTEEEVQGQINPEQ